MSAPDHACEPPTALRDAPTGTVWTCSCGRARRVTDHDGRRRVVDLERQEESA